VSLCEMALQFLIPLCFELSRFILFILLEYGYLYWWGSEFTIFFKQYALYCILNEKAACTWLNIVQAAFYDIHQCDII
ncbi:hypothetical protein, partial [Kingella kingae]|uniref:hypothetical protein n=1 Tax=Kingella kingae TaxID=504 RepID=UPI001CC3CAE3